MIVELPSGAVAGHRIHALGVEHFGQTGTVDDLYRHFGIDTASIVRQAEGALQTRAEIRRSITQVM